MEKPGQRLFSGLMRRFFSILDFDYKVLESRFREVSFLNAGLKINLHDKIKDKKEEFFFFWRFN